MFNGGAIVDGVFDEETYKLKEMYVYILVD